MTCLNDKYSSFDQIKNKMIDTNIPKLQYQYEYDMPK